MFMPSIMIADRDPNERSGISWLLSSWAVPYDQIYKAGTMEEVFQVLENHVPDVLCIELDMVPRSSWERLKLLVEQYRPIVIVMTAEATFEKAMLGIELHARDLWLKPQTPEAIRRVLTRYCQEKREETNRHQEVKNQGSQPERSRVICSRSGAAIRANPLASSVGGHQAAPFAARLSTGVPFS
jgi:two-component system, response regulator YesN